METSLHPIMPIILLLGSKFPELIPHHMKSEAQSWHRASEHGLLRWKTLASTGYTTLGELVTFSGPVSSCGKWE